MSSNRTSHIRIPVIALVTAAITIFAAVFAPAGFGSNLKTALWDEQPVVLFVPPVVAPGESLNCELEFADVIEEADEPFGASTTKGVSTKVTVFSDPPGIVQHNGFMDDPGDVISARVSLNAAPGPVTVYVKVGNSAPIGSNTLVVPN